MMEGPAPQLRRGLARQLRQLSAEVAALARRSGQQSPDQGLLLAEMVGELGRRVAEDAGYGAHGGPIMQAARHIVEPIAAGEWRPVPAADLTRIAVLLIAAAVRIENAAQTVETEPRSPANVIDLHQARAARRPPHNLKEGDVA